MAKGLNNETILEAAIQLVVEKGYDNFSLRELASRLEVKPASLYNHVSGVDEITEAVAMYAAGELRKSLEATVQGKEPDQAFADAAFAYLAYARQNPELYKSLIRMRKSPNDRIARAAYDCCEPIRRVIRSYGASPEENLHFFRSLRAFMHGFITLTENGFMQKGADPQETYSIVIRCILEKLKECGSHGKE